MLPNLCKRNRAILSTHDNDKMNRRSFYKMKPQSIAILLLLFPQLIASKNVPNGSELGSSKGNILFFHHMGTGSHVLVLSALARVLAQGGYNVTTAFWKKMGDDSENYHQLILSDR